MNVRRGLNRILLALSAVYWVGALSLVMSSEGTASRASVFKAMLLYYAIMAVMVFTLRWIARGFRDPA